MACHCMNPTSPERNRQLDLPGLLNECISAKKSMHMTQQEESLGFGCQFSLAIALPPKLFEAQDSGSEALKTCSKKAVLERGWSFCE